MGCDLQSGVGEGPVDEWVYLDSNVLIDLKAAFSGKREPNPADLTDRLRIAALRIFLYGYRDRCCWYLVSSGEARRELAKGGFDWTVSVIFDVDEGPGGLPANAVQSLGEQYVRQAGLSIEDARHLARAVIHPAIRRLVTSDRSFIEGTAALDLPDELEVVHTLDAEALLEIQPGERPPIAPVSGSPLAEGLPWWIP